ncbi:hypothetical protein THOM_2958 [Trachipleistophora hominis]|uniref:Uncharacterized protein n=1 Tax=Trachipleistophora hominis TaxID=72359 RepID=L7JS67_TRAHO|nr:hypothetical protein THOM_2958 [Trachipleistophora hominis]
MLLALFFLGLFVHPMLTTYINDAIYDSSDFWEFWHEPAHRILQTKKKPCEYYMRVPKWFAKRLARMHKIAEDPRKDCGNCRLQKKVMWEIFSAVLDSTSHLESESFSMMPFYSRCLGSMTGRRDGKACEQTVGSKKLLSGICMDHTMEDVMRRRDYTGCYPGINIMCSPLCREAFGRAYNAWYISMKLRFPGIFFFLFTNSLKSVVDYLTLPLTTSFQLLAPSKVVDAVKYTISPFNWYCNAVPCLHFLMALSALEGDMVRVREGSEIQYYFKLYDFQATLAQNSMDYGVGPSAVGSSSDSS